MILLGDLTDAKDNHSAVLVNRVVASIKRLAELVQVVVLRGNHDYLVADHPFFRFLNTIDNVMFINEITTMEADGGSQFLFLPHTRSPREDWKDVRWVLYNMIFAHQTVSGAIASNGERLDGELDPELGGFHDPSSFFPKIWSGDIHVPQVIGQFEYVGSPYHVHFGDRFSPRCVLLDLGLRGTDLHFSTIEKFVARVHSVQDLEALNLKPNDQLKVVVSIPTSMTSEWFKIKKQINEYCTSVGVKLYGTELEVAKRRRLLVNEGSQPIKNSRMGVEAAIRTFASKEKLPEDVINAGLEIAGVTQTPPQA